MSDTAAIEMMARALPDYSLDGQEPVRVFTPKSEEEAVEAVHQAVAEGTPLVPWGRGTGIETGNRLRAERWSVLSSGGLTRILEYSPDDMVVTAEPGVPLSALQSLLSQHNQFLPLDPPLSELTTLGGITARNAQGLLRPSFGQPRDRLLAARILMSDGAVARAGAKVVKNVAGYDLGKLICGSWGTLGMITEVTYKTNPIPASRRLATFAGRGVVELVEAALKIHDARLQPAYLVVTGPKSPLLSVGLMGSVKAVQWQLDSVTALLTNLGLSRNGEPAEGVGEREEALRSLVAAGSARVKVRIAVRPGEIPLAIAAMTQYASEILCHVASGGMEVAFSEDALPDVGDSPLWWTNRVRALLPGDAHLVWTRVPAEWKRMLDVWGPTRADFPLMRGLKEAFDPLALFSPGRFVGHL